ncbi:MAG: hypothetical protein Q9228_005337 [Teloschistes exilis]
MERDAEMRVSILGNADLVKFSHKHVNLSEQDDRKRWWQEELQQKSLTKLIPGVKLKWTPLKPDDTGCPEQRSGEQPSTKGSILAPSGIL